MVAWLACGSGWAAPSLVAIALIAGSPSSADPLFRDLSRGSGLPQTGPTRGLIATDLDGDGGLELLLNLHADAPPLVAKQVEPLRFQLRELDVGGLIVEDLHATSAADLDGDGRPELYLSVGADRGDGWGRKALLVVDDSRWTDIAPALGVTDPWGRGRAAMYLDLVGTPQLDLVVLNFRSAPRVFADIDLGSAPHDLATEVWDDVVPAPDDPDPGAAAPPAAERERTQHVYQLVPGYLGDHQSPWYLVWGARFRVQQRVAGRGLVAVDAPGLAHAHRRVPKHAAIADFDGDLLNDLYLAFGDGPPRSSPAYRNELYLQGPAGEFVRAPYEDGALVDGTGHRVHAADFDNDGHVDLLLLHRRDPNRDRQPTMLRGLGGGRFESVAEEWGLAGFRGGVSQDALVCDLDRDGDLDLVMAQGDHGFQDASGGYRLYENRADERGVNSIQFAPDAPLGGGADPYGARISVHAGGRGWIRDYWPTQNDGSTTALPVHVGLGSAAVIDSVTITWPDGNRETARAIPAGGIWHWREGEPPRQHR